MTLIINLGDVENNVYVIQLAVWVYSMSMTMFKV